MIEEPGAERSSGKWWARSCQTAWLGVLSLLLATSPSSAGGTQQTGGSVHPLSIPKRIVSLLEQEKGLRAWGGQLCGVVR